MMGAFTPSTHSLQSLKHLLLHFIIWPPDNSSITMQIRLNGDDWWLGLPDHTLSKEKKVGQQGWRGCGRRIISFEKGLPSKSTLQFLLCLNQGIGDRGRGHISCVRGGSVFPIKSLIQGAQLSPATFLSRKSMDWEGRVTRGRQARHSQRTQLQREPEAGVMKHARVITKLNCPSQNHFVFLW